jgi:hypothetical protein
MEGGAWEELDPMSADLQVSAASREGVEGALAWNYRHHRPNTTGSYSGAVLMVHGLPMSQHHPMLRSQEHWPLRLSHLGEGLMGLVAWNHRHYRRWHLLHQGDVLMVHELEMTQHHPLDDS